jgi:hypothetical protein
MKPTELRIVLVVAAAACGFFFRLGERSAVAQGVALCPQHTCKDVYGWWLDVLGTQCYAAKVKNETTNTTNAIPGIYATASTGQAPLVAAGSFDRWTYPTHNKTCGQVNGQWQSPQEVTPTGEGELEAQNRGRNVCTPKPIGGGT